MQGSDRERAVLDKMQDILRRLRPLVDDIAGRELVGREPHEETDQLRESLDQSLEQMEYNLNNLDSKSKTPS